VTNPEEMMRYQGELWAYIVAKHYGVTMQEAFMMGPDMFFCSLEWALASQKMEQEAMENATKGKGGGDSVSLDYTFPEDEGF